MNEQPIDEVTALKQRVHHLECLLDDCARVLAGLQTQHGVDLREFIGKICDNIPESEEEKTWHAKSSDGSIHCVDGKIVATWQGEVIEP